MQMTVSNDKESVNSIQGELSNPDDIWNSIVVEEETYIARLTNFRTNFHDAIISQWPALNNHLEAIVLMEKLVALHQEYICDVLNGKTFSRSSIGDPRIFITWASKTYKVLKEYSQRYPHALYALRLTQSRDKKFSPYVGALGLSLTYFGKTWEDYLALPITQLDSYIAKLQSLENHVQERSESFPAKEQTRLKDALSLLQRLKEQCSSLQIQSINREELQNLHRILHSADTKLYDRLEILATDRRILHQAPLAIKIDGHGSWKSVQTVLLDNYLFWGKTKSLSDWKQKEKRDNSILLVDQVGSNVFLCPSFSTS